MRSLILLALLVIFLQCFESGPVPENYGAHMYKKVKTPYEAKKVYGREYDEDDDYKHSREYRDGYAEDEDDYENNRIYKIKQIVFVNEDGNHHRVYPERRIIYSKPGLYHD